jgi:hypothetical protein
VVVSESWRLAPQTSDQHDRGVTMVATNVASEPFAGELALFSS